MIENINFTNCSKYNTRQITQVKSFLKSIDIKYSDDIEYFVIARENEDIIACGGIAKNTLKCIGVSQKYRGEGFVLSLMSEILKLAYSLKKEDLFLYTRAKNKHFFKDCGFMVVEEIKDEIVLMQNNNNFQLYKQSLKAYKKSFPKVASIVMNANPFTLGHQFLVNEAAKNCDWVHVFVVKENLSFFSYEDRLFLIKQGLKHLDNITIHKGSDYIISCATFPTYFLKESENINSLYSKLDANLFANHIAKQLDITYRYVANEPNCALTNEYNYQLKKTSLKVKQIERLMVDDMVISASKVRELLKKQDFENIKKLVPTSTYEFLKKYKQKEVMA